MNTARRLNQFWIRGTVGDIKYCKLCSCRATRSPETGSSGWNARKCPKVLEMFLGCCKSLCHWRELTENSSCRQMRSMSVTIYSNGDRFWHLKENRHNWQNPTCSHTYRTRPENKKREKSTYGWSWGGCVKCRTFTQQTGFRVPCETKSEGLFLP